MQQGTAVYVFPGANTSRGYRSFFRDGLQGLERVFILKGGPGCGKSTLIRKVGRLLQEKGHDVEYWQCSADPDSLDGVIVPELSAAVVDGTPPHVVEPVCPGAVEELVDLGVCWDSAELRRHKGEIVELQRQIGDRCARCRAGLEQAGLLLERSRENVEDTATLAQESDLLAQVFGAGTHRQRHLFASSVTPEGWVSLLEPLSRRARRRFILQGPFGGGKERLLAAVAEMAEQRRLNAELYHHPLAVEELQLVWLPELATAVVGTEEPLPERPGDVVISCGQPLDPARALADSRRVRELTDAGGRELTDAKFLHDRLEDCYRQAMDYRRADEIGDGLLRRLLELERE